MHFQVFASVMRVKKNCVFVFASDIFSIYLFSCKTKLINKICLVT